MRITILNVDSGKVPGKKYSQAEVLFDSGGDKKSWKLFDFANPAVYRVISNAQAGDSFDVEVGKNDRGYDSWISVTPASSGPKAFPDARQPTSTAATSRASTYETAEERARRQVLIVRQSSLTAAINTLSPGAKAPLNPEDVMRLAEVYVKFAFHEEDKDLFDLPDELPE